MSQSARASNKSLYEVQAFNDAVQSENRIHSDETAKRYGFESALVSGSVIFGHMSYLPVKTLGMDFFSNNRVDVKFIGPAYDGEVLTIEHEAQADGGQTHCFNIAKSVLSTMTSEPGEYQLNPASEITSPAKTGSRKEINWESLKLNKVYHPFHWEPDAQDNEAIANQVEDDHDIYRGEDAVLHPLQILRQCNAAFARPFILPAWIHAGSRVTLHNPLHANDSIKVIMVPTNKWKHKGHEFAALYVAFVVKGDIRVEVEHTAIFNIAAPG